MSPHERPRVEQEREGIAARAVVRVAIVAALVIVAAVVVSDFLLRRDALGLAAPVSPSTRPAAQAPRVIGIVDQTLTSGPGDGLVLNERKRLDLGHYGWVDRAHGLARIPIEEAMSIYVSRQSVADGGAIP